MDEKYPRDEIATLLDQALNPSTNKAAEQQLQQLAAAKPLDFSTVLLDIVELEKYLISTRLSAALCFKNFVRSNYIDENGNHQFQGDQNNSIKERLVRLMIGSPRNIQAQLGDAISIIANSDFWENWRELMPELARRLTEAPDSKTANGVLEVAHSICVRWRPLFRSTALDIEIQHVVGVNDPTLPPVAPLSHFGERCLEYLGTVKNKIEEKQGDASQLQGWFETLDLLVKLLYDFCCQELAGMIADNEGNKKVVCEHLQKFLVYDNPNFPGAHADDEEETVVESVKSNICSVLTLFFSKYDDDFERYGDAFIRTVLEVVYKTGSEKRFDGLVSKALQFLATVAANPRYTSAFNTDGLIDQIIEKLILPNISLRDSDMELFEDEPIEYIRRDLEGADTDSRRRAATDFLTRLAENNGIGHVVTEKVIQLIRKCLDTGDWRYKDVAVYLCLSVMSKGTATASQGVLQVNPAFQVEHLVEFYEQYIKPDLADPNAVPISKVNAIKYMHHFRSLLPRDLWLAAAHPLIMNMAFPNYVVYTYAAITVERVLFLGILDRTYIEPLSSELLKHLLDLIKNGQSPEKKQENEFLIRCIMRVLLVIKDGAVHILDLVLNPLVDITEDIKQNPSNPRFYYYHFEAIGALVRHCAVRKGTELMASLCVPFVEILNKDITEFAPYVCQLLAALLETLPGALEADHLKKLVGTLLVQAPSPVPKIVPEAPVPLAWLPHDTWLNRDNVQGRVRLLCAIVQKAAEYVSKEQGIMDGVLQIIGGLLAANKTQDLGFDVAETIVVSMPEPLLTPHMTKLQQRLLSMLEAPLMRANYKMNAKREAEKAQDLQKMKAAEQLPESDPRDVRFILRFARFYHLVSALKDKGLGTDYFVEHLPNQATNQDVFVVIYLQGIIQYSPSFKNPLDRKLAAISYARTLCNSTLFAEKYTRLGWTATFRALMDLLVNPVEVASGVANEAITEADVDDIGFGIGFTVLSTCKRPPRDDFPEITNVQAWVAQFMRTQLQSGRLGQFANERLTEGDRMRLTALLGQTPI